MLQRHAWVDEEYAGCHAHGCSGHGEEFLGSWHHIPAPVPTCMYYSDHHIIISYQIYHVIIMSYYRTITLSHNPSSCHHIIILSYQHQEFSSPWHHIPAVYTCTHTHLLFDVLSMTPPPHCVSNELVITPEFIQTVYETGPGVFLGEIAMFKRISPTQNIKISKYMNFIKYSLSKSIDQWNFIKDSRQ